MSSLISSHTNFTYSSFDPHRCDSKIWLELFLAKMHLSAAKSSRHTIWWPILKALFLSRKGQHFKDLRRDTSLQRSMPFSFSLLQNYVSSTSCGLQNRIPLVKTHLLITAEADKIGFNEFYRITKRAIQWQS